MSFKIENTEVGNSRTFIIAEVAQAHDGSLGTAHAYIDAASKTGVDAIKFQTHIASAESSIDEPWRVKFSRQDETRFDYWKRMEFSREQWLGLKEHAESRGLVFLSSPFSNEAVDLLEDLGISAWKIASGEVSNPLLLKHIAKTGKPVILSTGLSTYDELDLACSIFTSMDCPIAILQCTSSYPTPASEVGLNVMQELSDRYSCPAGLSDHTASIYTGIAAATLGASLLEVHITLSKDSFGPDVPASLTTEELAQLVAGIRHVETLLANPMDKAAQQSGFDEMNQIFRKSLYLAEDLKEGQELLEEHLVAKKPGTGIPAANYKSVLGKKLVRTMSKGEKLSLDDLD